MSLERTKVVDSIIVRPQLQQVGVKTVVTTTQDGEVVSRNYLEVYYSQGDDISQEDTLVQTVINNYWSTL